MAERSIKSVTLADRLEHGFVTVHELAELKNCGITTIYADIKAGALLVEKHGRATRISGPIAKDYRPGACHAKREEAA